MRPWLIFILPLALCACSPKSDEDADVKPVALVTTAPVARGTIDETVTAFGAAETAPGAEHSLAAPLEGVVARIDAPAGSTVKAGQAVVTLTPTPASRTDARKTDVDAGAAKAAYERALRLRAGGLDSDADVETARAADQAAAAAQAASQARLAGLTLRAPAAGVVEQVAMAPGDVAPAGALVAKVGSVADLRLRLGVEPGTAARIRPGAAVRLSPLGGGATVAAHVTAIDPRADPQTRLASLILAPDGGGLTPGQPVSGEVVVAAHQNALLIPRAAVVYDQDQPSVFVIAGGQAHRRPIKLGVATADKAEVLDGLAAGDHVAVEGAAELDDGMAVREGKAAPAQDDGGKDPA
jgi:RND family efflux transporter MFP subunit